MTRHDYLRALQRRHAGRSGIRAVLDGTFGAQREFVEDKSKLKAAVCSRRAGKTEAIAAWLLEGGWDSPGETSVYIALSKPHCRRMLWRTLIRIERRHHLGLWPREIDGQLIVQLPNEHQIWLAGCANSAETDKFRGDRYRRICIEEAGSHGSYMEELIEDACEPALMDLDGELALIGTPPPVPSGYFYAATTGDGMTKWPTHHWTIFENPHIPNAAAWVEERRQRRGWNLDHPRYLREYLGQWVLDKGALVFPYEATLNSYEILPPGQYRNCLGMDIGYVDSTAWVPMSWRDGHPELYIPKSYAESGLIPSRVAAYTQRWLGEFPGPVVVDTGGIGKGYAEEMRQRYGIPCEPAEKQHKMSAVHLFRGDMLSGAIKVEAHENAALLDEWARIQWTEDRTDIDPRCGQHLSDAALYAYRRARPWYRPEVEGPEYGSPEFLIQQSADEREDALRQVKNRQKQKWRRDKKALEQRMKRSSVRG